jgi:hypothetical protein
MFATQAGNGDAVAALRQAGADPALRDASGKTAAMMAGS